MNTGIIVAIAALALSVLGHAFATIWWAAKVTFSLEGIQKEIKAIKDEIREDGVEQKKQIEALWKRQDELKERVLTVETRGNHGLS